MKTKEMMKKVMMIAAVMGLTVLPALAETLCSGESAEVTKGGVTTQYTTLPAAFEAIGENGTGTVKLLADIDLGVNGVVYVPNGSDLTLNLNGKRIFQTEDTDLAPITYEAGTNGRLTINDTVGGGGITVNRASSAAADKALNLHAVCCSGANGTLTVNGGTFAVTNNCGSAVLFYKEGNGIWAFNGGTYLAESEGACSAQFLFCWGSTGKTFVTGGTYAIAAKNEAGIGIYVANAGTEQIEITDGDFNISTTHDWSPVFEFCNTCVIKGGTFNVTSLATGAIGFNVKGGALLIVSNGTFSVSAANNTATCLNALENARIEVAGGTFNAVSGTAEGYTACSAIKGNQGSRIVITETPVINQPTGGASDKFMVSVNGAWLDFTGYTSEYLGSIFVSNEGNTGFVKGDMTKCWWLSTSGGHFSTHPVEGKYWCPDNMGIFANLDAATKEEYPWIVDLISKITPQTVADTTFKIYTNDAPVDVASISVRTNSPAYVVYTAENGYYFADGTIVKTNTVNTAANPATADAPAAPVKLITYVAPVYVDNIASNGIAYWTTNTFYNYTVVTNGTFQIDGGVACVGYVNLVLCDGAKLTVTNVAESCAGIATDVNGSFTIYETVPGDAVSSSRPVGILDVTGDSYAAGIGGNFDVEGLNITINGGIVTARSGEADEAGAGIGGGSFAGGSNITINGGTVTAMSGDLGSGIGGGYDSDGSNITINGGTVTATGGCYAAGIGGGGEGGRGEHITINGGTVATTGGEGAAGIGGGSESGASDITIKGGVVTAIGGLMSPGVGGGGEGAVQNVRIANAVVFVGTTDATVDEGEGPCRYSADLIGGGGGSEESSSGIVIEETARVFFNLTGVWDYDNEVWIEEPAPMPEDFEGFVIMTPETQTLDRVLVGGVDEGGAAGVRALPFALTNAATAATSTIAVNGAGVVFANRLLALPNVNNKLTLTAAEYTIINPPAEVENTTATVYTNNAVAVIGTGLPVVTNTSAYVVYTAEDGYVFADGNLAKTNTVNTAANPATADAPAAPFLAVARVSSTGLPYSSLAAAVAAAADSGDTITMLANDTLTASITTGKGFTLDLNGKTIDGAGKYCFSLSGMSVTIDDASGINAGLVTNCLATSDGGGAIRFSGGKLTLNGGTFVGNVANSGSGGAFFVFDADFEMNGGVVCGNRAPNGGGVAQSTAGHTFVLNGGVISNNVANAGGGGVSLAHAAMIFNGGTITCNTAQNGGGILISESNTVFTNVLGIIRGNKASNEGGGVRIDSGTMVMTGGAVSGNAVTGTDKHAGGISNRGGTLTITGGSVDHNVAKKYGGGLYINGKTTIGGTAIFEANVAPQGAGVFMLGSSTAKSVTGNVRLVGNTATADGGGIYLYSGALSVSGAVFESNAANGTTGPGNYPGAGGGIYAKNGTTLTLTNIRLEGNTSKWGAGMYPMGTTTINSAAFTNNIASISGSAIYSGNNGVLTINDCSIDVTNIGNSQAKGKGIWATASSTILLKGGTYAASVNMDGVKPTSAVTGGRFSVPITCTLTKTILPIVTGGVYTDAAKDGVTNGLVPNEYAFIANTDEETKAAYPWAIGPDTSHIAMIGDVKYETLGDAMTNAVPGVTVRLINATDESVEVPTGVTFNKNGKDYTGTLTAPDGSFIRDNGDETYVSLLLVAEIRTPAVTNRYDSIASAISAVATNGTVTLINAEKAETSLTVSLAKPFVLDLAAKTLTTVLTVDGGLLTLSNGTVKATVTLAGGMLNVVDGARLVGPAAVDVTGGYLNVTGGFVQGGTTNAVLLGTNTSIRIAGGTFLAPEGLVAVAYKETAESGLFPSNFIFAAVDAQGQETGYPLFGTPIPAGYIGFGYMEKNNYNDTWTVTAGNPELRTAVSTNFTQVVTNTVAIPQEEEQTVTNQVNEIKQDLEDALKKTNDDDFGGTGINEATKNEDGTLQDYVLEALTNAAPEEVKGAIDANTTVESYIEVKLQGMGVIVSSNASESAASIVKSTLMTVLYDVKPIVTTKIIMGSEVVTVTTNLEGQTLPSPVAFRLELQKTFPSDLAKVSHAHGGSNIVETCLVQTAADGAKWIETAWQEFCRTLVEAETLEGVACWANGKVYSSVTNALDDTSLPQDATIVLLKDCTEENIPLGYDQIIDRNGYAFTGTLTTDEGTELVRGKNETIYVASNAVDVVFSDEAKLPVRGYPFPPEITSEQAKEDYLSATGDDGRPHWVPYILGTNEKLLPLIVGAKEGFSTVTIRATDAYLAGIANMPAKSGVAVRYNLVMKKSGDASFTQYGSTTNVPYFQVNVKDVPAKTFWKIQMLFDNAED